MAKRRKPRPVVYRTSGSARVDLLDSGKQLASDLIDRQRYEDALLVVQRLAVDYPEDPDVLMMLGICTDSQGDLFAAIANFERAYTRGRNPRRLPCIPWALPACSATCSAALIHAFTESQRQGLPIPADMQPAQAQLRRDVGAIATQLHLPIERVIAGLRDMERATLLLDQGEYAGAAAANRGAIKALGDWPPPHNNLAAPPSISMARFPPPSPNVARCWRKSARTSRLGSIWCVFWRGAVSEQPPMTCGAPCAARARLAERSAQTRRGGRHHGR